MAGHRIFGTAFSKIYPMYVQKVRRKGRTREELDEVVRWLTGYAQADLARQLAREVDLETFFAEAPALHANRDAITGLVCGVRVEAVEDPLMREIRRLDKLVDELAKGRALEKVLR